jgi:hypothetical protein
MEDYFQVLRRVCKIAKSAYKFCHVCLSVHPPTCVENSALTTDFHEIWCLNIFQKSVQKIQVALKSDETNRYFIWRSILIIPCSGLRMRNVSDKSCRENQNTHFMFSNFVYFLNFKSCLYDVMWKNIVEVDRPQMTIRSMRIVCWLPDATNTFTQYVILIALPLQQWLHKCVSLLCYTYIACLV